MSKGIDPKVTVREPLAWDLAGLIPSRLGHE